MIIEWPIFKLVFCLGFQTKLHRQLFIKTHDAQIEVTISLSKHHAKKYPYSKPRNTSQTTLTKLLVNVGTSGISVYHQSLSEKDKVQLTTLSSKILDGCKYQTHV